MNRAVVQTGGPSASAQQDLVDSGVNEAFLLVDGFISFLMQLPFFRICTHIIFIADVTKVGKVLMLLSIAINSGFI